MPGQIQIRPYRLEDDQAAHEAVRESMAELKPWMSWCHDNFTLQEHRVWIEAQVPAFENGTAFEFAIWSDAGRFLGGCGLNHIDSQNRRANLGYWVRTSAMRQGVANSAVRMLKDWAFSNTDLMRLELIIAVDNVASLRVAEKSGAVREGILRNRLLLHGTPHDAAVFSFVAR